MANGASAPVRHPVEAGPVGSPSPGVVVVGVEVDAVVAVVAVPGRGGGDEAGSQSQRSAAKVESAKGSSTVPDWAALTGPTYLNFRKASIYGGSNEVQRKIIAGTILGL